VNRELKHEVQYVLELDDFHVIHPHHCNRANCQIEKMVAVRQALKDFCTSFKSPK
jgi:hypothetical protein